MTPAIAQLKKTRTPHTLHHYQHTPGEHAYGHEAVEKLGVDENRVFKTLVARLDQGDLVVAVLPVATMLSMKQLAKTAGARRAAMADPAEVMKATGYVLGGVSPLGQKKNLPTWIDSSAQAFSTILVSAGRRGLQVELNPADLARLTNASFALLQGTSSLA
jgi:Cys-tRNA(Pro)/Cys-tRNA(Cys) deacylase